VQHASLAIVGGAVWAPGAPRVTAVAIDDGVISAVGSDADIRRLIGRRTRVIEARGGTILPAFNDAHIHFLMGSRGLVYLDLFGAETQDEIERRIRDFNASNRAPWLLARGWFYAAFPGGMPTIELLDRLVPDRPAYLESFDTHVAWVNSRALEAAGMAPGAEPGILKEQAMDDFEQHLPAPSTDEDLESLRTGMKMATASGIASFQEASRGLKQMPLYETLREHGELTMRVRLAFDMLPGIGIDAWAHTLDMYEEASRAHKGDRWISTGIVKAFADGVVESRTALLLEPYVGIVAGDPGALGTSPWEPGELAAAVRAASTRGWQVEIHAIGDRAIRDALDAFAACEPARRHRIEHIEAPATADIARFGRLGVIASMQPQHAEPVKNLREIWAPNLGPERATHGWPWASIARGGGRLAFGSDWPVVPIDPFLSLHVAINRQTRRGDPPGGWLPGERLGLSQAVEAWTSGSAYAEHAEHVKGRLREGMLADIAVLDRDLEKAPPGEITQTKVEATVVGGRLVFER
jgi:predicted amidohydrolase YtcJ